MITRRVPLWAAACAAVVALIVGIAAGSGAKKKDGQSVASASVTATATTTATANTTTTATSAAPAAAAAVAAATVTVTQAAKPAAPVTVTATAPAPSPAAPAGFSDGTYIVGTDIKPGLYKTTGPASSVIPNCYWERDRDLEDGLNSIIANDNSKGPMTVKIATTDKAFKTSGCTDWVKIG